MLFQSKLTLFQSTCAGILRSLNAWTISSDDSTLVVPIKQGLPFSYVVSTLRRRATVERKHKGGEGSEGKKRSEEKEGVGEEGW